MTGKKKVERVSELEALVASVTLSFSLHFRVLLLKRISTTVYG